MGADSALDILSKVEQAGGRAVKIDGTRWTTALLFTPLATGGTSKNEKERTFRSLSPE